MMEFYLGPVLMLIFCCLFALEAAWIYHKTTVSKKLAKIEELRHKAKNFNKLDLQTQGIVIGQITKANYDIKGMQRCKQRSIVEWVIPDEWNEVKLIPLSKEDNEPKEWEIMNSKERLVFLQYLKEKSV